VVTPGVRLVVIAALAEVVEDALRAGSRVREDERVGVFGDEFVELGVKPVRDHAARRVYQIVRRTAQLDVEPADEPRVDDLELAGLPAIGGQCAADQKLSDGVERFDSRRAPDPGRGPITEPFEPFERHRQMRAAFVRRERVDLVDDDVLDGLEFPLELRAVQQNRERLRRRVEDVRCLLQHPLAIRVARVAVSDRVPNLDGFAPRFQPLGDPLQWFGQVPMDVVRERFQR
jgi:hypothetical protein